jgi:sigma-B regulation protein RsbU (phosphoserine phosphatase)
MYAYFGIGRIRWMPIAVVAHLAVTFAMSRWIPPGPELVTPLDRPTLDLLAERLKAVSLMAILLMGAAYALFITLFSREGRRFGSVQTEIRLAQEIHRTLVPPLAGKGDGLEWLGRSEPSGAVGGDLVDVVHARSGWWGIVADVTGHGVGAGLVMGMFKTALRAHVDAAQTPSDLLERINRTLAPLRQPNMLVTVACLRRRSATEIEYAFAGHPPMLHLSSNSAPPAWVGEPQLAIGIVDEARYDTGVVTVSRGDVLLVVTDGLLEVFDRRDTEIGPDGILRAITVGPADASLDDLQRRVFDACRRHGTQDDDQTLLLIRA